MEKFLNISLPSIAVWNQTAHHVRIPLAPSLERSGTDTGFESHPASSLRLNKLLWIRFTCLVCSLLFCFAAIMGSWVQLCFKWWQTAWILLVMCFPALGQHCHNAGLLPWEDACQLVEDVKERLRGRCYCTRVTIKRVESRRTKSSHRSLSLWMAPEGCIWIDNKCFNNDIFVKASTSWRVIVKFGRKKKGLWFYAWSCACLVKQPDRSDFSSTNFPIYLARPPRKSFEQWAPSEDMAEKSKKRLLQAARRTTTWRYCNNSYKNFPAAAALSSGIKHSDIWPNHNADMLLTSFAARKKIQKC